MGTRRDVRRTLGCVASLCEPSARADREGPRQNQAERLWKVLEGNVFQWRGLQAEAYNVFYNWFQYYSYFTYTHSQVIESKPSVSHLSHSYS